MRSEIRQRIELLRAERGDAIPVEELGAVVDGILRSLNGDVTGADLRLYREIQELAEYIETAKAEIAAIRPQDIGAQHIQVATDELDAIVGHTEEATGAILDAAEKLEALAAGLDAPAAAAVRGAVTRIYEACNFQDITGQRITRVVRALKDIEAKVAAIVGTFAESPGELRRKAAARAASGAKPAEATLLNGPQLPEAAQSQRDIDAILAALK